MLAKDVLKKLNISRTQLSRYAKNGTIKYSVLENGQYDYDESDVHRVNIKRAKTIILTPRFPFKQKILSSWVDKQNFLNIMSLSGESAECLYSIIYMITKHNIDRFITYKFDDIFTDRERQVLELLCKDNRVEIISVSELEDTKR